MGAGAGYLPQRPALIEPAAVLHLRTKNHDLPRAPAQPGATGSLCHAKKARIRLKNEKPGDLTGKKA